MTVDAGLINPQIPMGAKFSAPDIPMAMSKGLDLKQKQIETENGVRENTDANADREVLKNYMSSEGGDLYSVVGITKATQDLKGKVSMGTYAKLQDQSQKLKTQDLEARAKINAMDADELKTSVGRNNLILGQMAPALEAYAKDKEASGEQDANAKFEANRTRIIENLAAQKDSTGKPLLPPEMLKSMQSLSPDQLSGAVRTTKVYHDIAESRWKDSQTKANEALVKQREAATAKLKNAPASDKLHIKELDGLEAQGLITPEAAAAARAGILTKLAAPAAASKSGMSDDDALFTARQYIQGDKTVLSGLGFGNVGAANRAAVRTAIRKEAEAQGLSPEQVTQKIAEFEGTKSGERALGTRTASLGMAAAAANNFADLVLETSNQVDRTEYSDLNKIIVAGEKRTGDPKAVQFGIAVNSFINAYARAINPQGAATVSDKDHARELLSTAFSKGQIEAAIIQLQKEIAAEQKAPRQVKEEMRKLAGADEARRVSPDTQKARDSDAVTILQAELKKETEALSKEGSADKRVRIQGNIDALNRELKAKGNGSSATAKSAVKKLTYDPATGSFK